MPAIQAADIADLVTGTLQDLGERKWTDLTTDLQNFFVLPQLIKKGAVMFRSGYGLRRNIMIDKNGNVSWVGLYNEDVVSQADYMQTMDVPFRHMTANWALDEHEVSMNSGPRQLVDLLEEREQACLAAIAENLEGKFFNEVDDTTVDPWGLPHWVVKNNTEGFNGGNPTGYSNVGGFTHARWKNYTGQYTAVDKLSLIPMMRKAAYKTNFKSPVQMPSYSTGDQRRYLTNYAVSAEMESILESQNDNLGNSVNSKDGMVMFQRRPLEVVSYLDDDTTNPVYGINMGTFKTVILKGWNLKRKTKSTYERQHNVAVTFYDLSCNWYTTNRRDHFVLALNTGGV